MHVQAAVFGGLEEPRRDEEAKGHGDDQVDRVALGIAGRLVGSVIPSSTFVEVTDRYLPSPECIDLVQRQGEISRDAGDWNLK